MLSAAIHELGHIVIGLTQGFKFYLFIAGPFGFRRSPKDKIVFYIEKNISLWGGLSATLPKSDDIINYKKLGRVFLGGPITSFVIGFICLPFGIIANNIFLLLLGAMALSMGLVCLIPARNGVFYTDGGRWLRLNKNEETRNVELSIWNLSQCALVNGNYKRLNRDQIITLINDRDIRTQYLGHYFSYRFYKDINDGLNIEKEKNELENLRSKVPKQMIHTFPIN
jgi:hypothetical protein